MRVKLKYRQIIVIIPRQLKDQFIFTGLDKLISFIQNLKTMRTFSSLLHAILETRESTKTLYERSKSVFFILVN